MLDVAQLSDLETAKQVAQLLEHENKRLHARLSELTQTLAELRGENGSEQLSLELTRLREQVDRMQHRLFGGKSEKRASGTRRHAGEEVQVQAPTPPRGHGPTSQPKVPVIERTETLDEHEQSCRSCGGQLEEWKGQFETSDVITVIRRSFIIEHQKRQKYRCRCHANIVARQRGIACCPVVVTRSSLRSKSPLTSTSITSRCIVRWRACAAKDSS